MAKFFFKRILPSHDLIKRQRMLRPLTRYFKHAAIWQVNRQSIARGMAIGVFCGALPLPIQTLLAAIIAILSRVNLPAAMFSTLWSNPLTMAPAFYVQYRLGCWLLGVPPLSINDEMLHIGSLSRLGGHILLPLFSGSLIVGVVLGAITYGTIIGWWRWHLLAHQRIRRERWRTKIVVKKDKTTEE